jgi:alpha-L-fucosidase
MRQRVFALLLFMAPGACSLPAQSAPQPLPPVPTPRQLEWQALERCAFAHFGVDTFTDAEWGTGSEPESAFNPTDFDARQWVRALKDAGFRGLILTAKHHDGFCLWPSKFSEHTVAQSPWKGGKGDVVREVADACREAGVKFGVYLSPWDRHEPSYGDSPRYDQHYVDQLTELLTNYGPIFEVWWDGACGEGPNGRKQEYDWARYREVVRRLQPQAVIFSDVGPDVRWVGNENGFAGETCWGMISPEGKVPGIGAPSEQELNEGRIDGTQWIPAECDVSIRPGWFWHASQDGQVKSVKELLEIWYASVGRGANLLLNVPPDRRGRFHENDVARLKEFDSALKSIFARDLARGAKLDRGPNTVRLELPAETEIDHVVLGEDIALGQRVEAFNLRADGHELAKGTTIGRKRVLRIPPARVKNLVLEIEKSRAEPVISTFELYDSPPEVTIVTAERSFVGALEVELACDHESAQIRYTLDGSEPTRASALLTGKLRLEKSCTLRARAFQGERAGLFEARADFRCWRADELLPAMQFIRRPDPGLTRTRYDGARTSLADLHEETAGALDNVAGFDLSGAGENVAFAFRGNAEVPADGVWTFATSSDDGSRLLVDGHLVVDNDGPHGMRERSGEIGLRAGWHALELQWFNGGGGAGLEVRWSGPGVARQPIPAERLGH